MRGQTHNKSTTFIFAQSLLELPPRKMKEQENNIYWSSRLAWISA